MSAFGKKLVAAGATLVVLVVLAVLAKPWAAQNFTTTVPRNLPQVAEAVASCMDSTSKTVKLEHSNLDDLKALSAYCFELVRHSDALQRKRVDDLAYIDQYPLGHVILGMVLVITLSGVLLAGMQVWAGYHASSRAADAPPPPGGGAAAGDAGKPPPATPPAAIDKDETTIQLEAGKLFVKSSVTGLLILVVSLAFFFLYLKFVYRIQEPPSAASTIPLATIPDMPGAKGSP